jgi:hypothetical protein
MSHVQLLVEILYEQPRKDNVDGLIGSDIHTRIRR